MTYQPSAIADCPKCGNRYDKISIDGRNIKHFGACYQCTPSPLKLINAEENQCPVCCSRFDADTEQAISIERYDECIACKFIPNSGGSGNGTKEELNTIRAEQKRRAALAVKAEKPRAKLVRLEALTVMNEPHLRIDWDNDRHQLIELTGHDSTAIINALERAVQLLSIEHNNHEI